MKWSRRLSTAEEAQAIRVSRRLKLGLKGVIYSYYLIIPLPYQSLWSN